MFPALTTLATAFALVVALRIARNTYQTQNDMNVGAAKAIVDLIPSRR